LAGEVSKKGRESAQNKLLTGGGKKGLIGQPQWKKNLQVRGGVNKRRERKALG